MESGGTSRHHLAWNRCWYKTPLERRYRNIGALIVPDVPNPQHRELHASLPPPPKPTPELMAGALARLQQADITLPLDGLFVVTEYMFERDTKLSNKIGDHLLAQAAYLDLARV